MNRTVSEILEGMRDSYRGKTFSEISSLGWIDQVPVKIGWKKYYPSIWSERYGGDSAILVVQLTKWHIPKFFGTTDCIGFIKSKNGDIEDVDAYWLMHEIGHP
ncbi:hypothetical protein [Marinimicrobium locisalis]|uniref:hypothetical protein n=1 Tax=Marinimicrobium locisalis TaxID=546022 RepID=UPI003221B975